jgi:cytidine deaminase
MESLDQLFAAAKLAQSHAHAPYSNFHVGAAVRTPEGRIFAGCNVENAALPNGICAETAALGAMVAAGFRQVDALLIIGDGAELITPCGGCRQRIREFAEPSTKIHIAGPQGLRETFTLAALLPHSFGPDHLVKRVGRGTPEDAPS